MKTDVNLFSRLLSVSGERDVDVQNILFRELCAVPLDLFYSNGAMRLTAKSNLLNEIEIKRCSLPSLMGNPDIGATVTDFMVILQSIDYSKFERFFNVDDEISKKLLSSFLECKVLAVVFDRYDFEFSIRAGERKRWTEIIDNRKVSKSFQSCPKNSNNKTNLVKYLFQKWRETLPNALTSSQTIYLANLDSTADRAKSRSSERIDFYCDHEEADTKIFAYIKFLCDNICLKTQDPKKLMLR